MRGAKIDYHALRRRHIVRTRHASVLQDRAFAAEGAQRLRASALHSILSKVGRRNFPSCLKK